MKIFIALLIMAAIVTGCGKEDGPAEPPDDEHDQGSITSFNNYQGAPDLAVCSRIRTGLQIFVS